MKVVFKNRYGTEICLERIDINKVIMTGYDGNMLRYAWSDNGYKSIDPSGGPYIQTGDNLKYYFETDENMYINNLTYTGKEIIFYIDETDKTKDKNFIDKR